MFFGILQLLLNIIYIIPHLYVAKDFWSFKSLDQFWKVLWIFKVLEFHVF